MCGILGYIGRSDAVRSRFDSALRSLEHRGPDGSGTWASEDILLGHRRLAIIDPTAASDQPMVDPDTGLVISFNGEIFNYVEIREMLRLEGAKFRTGSDTEVLLKAYAFWGPNCVSHFNGMWAFAIWDPRERKLFLSRDRFGVKPLYFAETGDGLIFASEPKALLTLSPSLAEPDPISVAAFVRDTRSFTGDRSFYKDIKSFRAGCNGYTGVVSKLHIRRYWDYPGGDYKPKVASDTALDEFNSLIESAVNFRLRSDVPVGLTLSGGLDSSAILAAARKSAPGIICYSAGYGDLLTGEEEWAKIAADTASSSLEFVSSSLNDWQGILEKIVWHMDAPGYSPAVLPLWEIMSRAREQGTLVLLEGQGADELLGGYVKYTLPFLSEALSSGAPTRVVRILAGSFKTFGFTHTMGWVARTGANGLFSLLRDHYGLGRLLHPDFLPRTSDDMYAGMDDSNSGDLFPSLQTDHGRNILPALLQYGDAVSMAHGVESRLPFMDYRLVEWVFRTRPDLTRGGWSKSPVRDYLQQEGFERIASRRRKMGFPTPFGCWLRENSGQVKSLILDNNYPAMWTILDRSAVSKYLNKATTGRRVLQVYKLLTLSIWFAQLSSRSATTEISESRDGLQRDGMQGSL